MSKMQSLAGITLVLGIAAVPAGIIVPGLLAAGPCVCQVASNVWCPLQSSSTSCFGINDAGICNASTHYTPQPGDFKCSNIMGADYCCVPAGQALCYTWDNCEWIQRGGVGSCDDSGFPIDVFSGTYQTVAGNGCVQSGSGNSPIRK